jgi:hypothetical protein
MPVVAVVVRMGGLIDKTHVVLLPALVSISVPGVAGWRILYTPEYRPGLLQPSRCPGCVYLIVKEEENGDSK